MTHLASFVLKSLLIPIFHARFFESKTILEVPQDYIYVASNTDCFLLWKAWRDEFFLWPNITTSHYDTNFVAYSLSKKVVSSCKKHETVHLQRNLSV